MVKVGAYLRTLSQH